MSGSKKALIISGSGSGYSEIIVAENALMVEGDGEAGETPTVQADGSVAWKGVLTEDNLGGPLYMLDIPAGSYVFKRDTRDDYKDLGKELINVIFSNQGEWEGKNYYSGYLGAAEYWIYYNTSGGFAGYWRLDNSFSGEGDCLYMEGDENMYPPSGEWQDPNGTYLKTHTANTFLGAYFETATQLLAAQIIS